MERVLNPAGSCVNPADDFDPLNEPGPLLRRSNQRSQDLYATIVGSDGPTHQQLAIMLALARADEGSATQSRLAVDTGVDRNTIAEILRRLITRGLVQKRPHGSDSRASLVRLTPAGAALVAAQVPKIRQVQQEILAPIPHELRSVFIYCLRKIAAVDGTSERAAAQAEERANG